MSDERPPPSPAEIAALEAEAPPAASSTAGGLLAIRGAADRRAARKRGQKLFNLGTAAVAIAIGYFILNSHVADPLHLYLGVIIFVLAALPGLMWAKRGEYGMPLFEAFMITGANTFAIPLLNGYEGLRQYDTDTITVAGLGVLVYQLAANITFFSAPALPKRGPVWRKEIVSRDISRVLGYGMILTTIYTVVIVYTDWIPNEIAPEIRAVCFGIGIIATFVQSRRWGEGNLPHRDRMIFVVQVILQAIFSWVSLFMVGGVSILVLGLIGYVSGSRKLPFLAIAMILPIIGVLFNGKATMREKYWHSDVPQPTILEIPAFFGEWIADGLETRAKVEQGAKSAGVLDRTSLIQIICLVASISPDKKPYLMGETYAQIPAQFVPRIIWETISNTKKPLGHISTFTLTIYYGIQTSMEEAQQTTIGFGLVSEAYANFGMVGTCMIGVFFGLFFKKITGWARLSPIFSYPGLFMVVLMAWTFQTELPLSAWLSSLEQACVCVLGLPLVLRNFFK